MTVWHPVFWASCTIGCEGTRRGSRLQKLTQYLTPEEGKPRLRELLEGVKALMKTSTDWKEFMARLDLVYPRLGDTLPLPFHDVLRIESKSSVSA